MGREALLHLGDFGRRYAEVSGHSAGFIRAQPAQVALQTSQIEKQFTLRLGGGDAHQTPVAQHVFVDFGADPMHRERHQPHAHTRVEALDRLHQADVAFLHQIAHRQTVAAIATGDMHHESQVREHQLARGAQIVLLAESARQLLLVLAAQHRYAADSINVGIETAQWPGNAEVSGVRHQCGRCGHLGQLLNGFNGVILALYRFEC